MRIFCKKSARGAPTELFAAADPPVAAMLAQLHKLPPAAVFFELDGQRVPCDGVEDYSLACRLRAAYRHAVLPVSRPQII